MYLSLSHSLVTQSANAHCHSRLCVAQLARKRERHAGVFVIHLSVIDFIESDAYLVARYFAFYKSLALAKLYIIQSILNKKILFINKKNKYHLCLCVLSSSGLIDATRSCTAALERAKEHLATLVKDLVSRPRRSRESIKDRLSAIADALKRKSQPAVARAPIASQRSADGRQ